MSRLGHGPFGDFWPIWPVTVLYSLRPDLHTTKTRVPEWEKLQSPWRFLSALLCYLGPPSHVLWNIKWPYLGVIALAVIVEAFETYMDIMIDSIGALTQALRLTSFAMSLLLALRLNRTYERWKEARSSIAGVGNGATTIFLQASTWIKDNDDLKEDFRRWCIVWPYSIMQTVTSAKSLDPIAAALLHPNELKVYADSRKGRQVVVTKMRQMASEANLTMEQFQAMEGMIQVTWKAAGDSLRIKFQAMPLGISLMCTGFVQVWCLLLPLTMSALSETPGQFNFICIFATAVVSVLLLVREVNSVMNAGCDEVANQMEEPFQLMPLDDIMVTYVRDINRVSDELAAIRYATKADKLALQQNLNEGMKQSGVISI